MTPFLPLLLLSVSMSAVAQLLLKLGMSDAMVQQVLARGDGFETFRVVALNGYVIAGLLVYLSSVAAWLLVLARLDVSAAYPFVGVGFVLTMIFGSVVLHEPVGLLRVIGTVLVAAGIFLIAGS